MSIQMHVHVFILLIYIYRERIADFHLLNAFLEHQDFPLLVKHPIAVTNELMTYARSIS